MPSPMTASIIDNSSKMTTSFFCLRTLRLAATMSCATVSADNDPGTIPKRACTVTAEKDSKRSHASFVGHATTNGTLAVFSLEQSTPMRCVLPHPPLPVTNVWCLPINMPSSAAP
jgi:hypothetical protein